MGLILLIVKKFQEVFKEFINRPCERTNLILLPVVLFVEIPNADSSNLCCKVVKFHKYSPLWKTLAETRHARRAEAF